jgi:hypothetical protein
MKKTIAIALIVLPMALAACMTGDPSDGDPTASDPTEDTSPDGPVPVPADAQILSAHQAVLDRVMKAADPQAAYAQLSAADRAEFDSLTRPAGEPSVTTTLDGNTPAITPDAATAAKFNGCFSVHATGGRKAFFGNTLYTFWQTTKVCAKGGKVTSVAVTSAGGETSTPGWRIAHAPTTSKLNVGWEGRGKAAYHFVLGAGPWDIQHPSDCLQLRLNADGKHFRVMTSCDLEAR